MAPHSVPASDRSRTLALVVLCAGMLMNILDQTIVSVALPSIQADLGFSQSGLAWVVNAYLIPFGGLLLLAGRLGDLVGRTRVFLAGLVVFTAASLLCGLATSPGLLVGARFLQGVGGALTSAVILGMIVRLYPEPGGQGRAIGAFSFAAAAGGSIGLIVGGLLTQALSWHWIFFVNVPIGLLVLAAARRLLARDRGLGLAAGADVAGGALVTSGLMLGVYAIVGAADRGWLDATTLAVGGSSLALLAAFAVRQATAARPLLPLRLLRSRDVSGANAVQVLLVAGMFGFQFTSALYLQRVLGYEAAQVGLAILPAAVAIGALSLGASARLGARFGSRAVLLPGLALIVVGLALLARVPVDGRYAADVLPGVLLAGVGFGLGFPALTTLAMSGASADDSGLASGLFNTTQQVGGALGLAVLATLAAARTDSLAAAGGGTAAALTGGYRLAFGVAAGLAATALVLAAVVLRRPRPAPAGAIAPADLEPATADAA
ncbi:MAG TPA: DHA2 family efflux MFS transporter permease subunit [Acidimicrobiales bacterium]